MQISARNQLVGKIIEIKLGGVMAEILIQLATGEELASVITRSSVTSLDLKVGDTVVAVIKSTEVMVGKE